MSLRAYLDRIEPNFHPGGKYQKFYALYEAVDTIFYAPGTTTKSTAHVRDGIDLKRIMITVWMCTFPAIFFGAFFLGQNASEAIAAGAMNAVVRVMRVFAQTESLLQVRGRYALRAMAAGRRDGHGRNLAELSGARAAWL